MGLKTRGVTSSVFDDDQALRLLAHIQTRHASSIVALHQHRLALAHFDRIVGLRDGCVVLNAPACELTLAHLDALYPDAGKSSRETEVDATT